MRGDLAALLSDFNWHTKPWKEILGMLDTLMYARTDTHTHTRTHAHTHAYLHPSARMCFQSLQY